MNYSARFRSIFHCNAASHLNSHPESGMLTGSIGVLGLLKGIERAADALLCHRCHADFPGDSSPFLILNYFGPSTSRLCTILYTLVWCIWCAVGIATLLTDSCDGIVECSKFPLTF